MTPEAAAERAVARCRELAKVSDVAGQTTRTFLSPATRDAHVLMSGWMRSAGLAVETDPIGNLRGLLGQADAPRLLVGSHLDTVIDAGAFDGPLGVMLGIELAAAIAAEGPRPYGIEVLGFSDEEGVRFGKPFLGSLAVVGEADEAMLGLRDAAGVPVAEAVRAFGLTTDQISQATVADTAFAYLEFHIEQGPVLEDDGLPVALVEGIAGQTRMQVRFRGHTNHAGTTPMGHLRRDAIAAGAEWITEVERYANGCAGLVATVGKVEVPGGAGNVIAGECMSTLDVRHAKDELRSEAVRAMVEAADAAGTKRGVSVEHDVLLEQHAVEMDELLTDAIASVWPRACGSELRRMTSGAGHDAMVMARRVPAAMVFLRTPGGLSHHPDESVAVEDVGAAFRVGMEFLRSLRDDRAMLDRLVNRGFEYSRTVRNA